MATATAMMTITMTMRQDASSLTSRCHCMRGAARRGRAAIAGSETERNERKADKCRVRLLSCCRAGKRGLGHAVFFARHAFDDVHGRNRIGSPQAKRGLHAPSLNIGFRLCIASKQLFHKTLVGAMIDLGAIPDAIHGAALTTACTAHKRKPSSCFSPSASASRACFR